MSDAVPTELPNPNAIRAEAIKGLAEKGPKYFNNLKLNLPAGPNEVSFYRKLWEESIKKGKKIDSLIGDDYKTAEQRKDHSNKFLNQTHPEYFETIDTAIKDTGSSPNKIGELQRKLKKQMTIK